LKSVALALMMLFATFRMAEAAGEEGDGFNANQKEDLRTLLNEIVNPLKEKITDYEGKVQHRENKDNQEKATVSTLAAGGLGTAAFLSYKNQLSKQADHDGLMEALKKIGDGGSEKQWHLLYFQRNKWSSYGGQIVLYRSN